MPVVYLHLYSEVGRGCAGVCLRAVDQLSEATAGELAAYLVVHELQREGRFAHSSAAHHDDLVQGQRALVLALAVSHR